MRQQVANRPLLLFAALFIAAALLLRRRAAPIRASKGLPIVAALAIIGYASLVIWYVTRQTYADAAEPTIAVVATLFDAGLPVYHARDTAERYSHIYGPLAFILPSWWMSIAGFTIPASKGLGAVAGLSSVAVVFALAGGRRDARTALMLTGLFCGLCLTFQHVSFWNRPDSLLVLLAALAMLVAAHGPERLVTGVVLGVIAGALAGLKITGPLYALPAFAVLISRRRFAAVAAGVIIAAAVAVLPFVAFGSVSFVDYLTWVRISASNGLVFWILKQNLESAVYLTLPVLAAFARAPRSTPDAWVVGSVAVGLVAVALAAAKPGAGPYHLLPFVPAIVHAVRPAVSQPRAIDDRTGLAGAWCLAVSVAAIALLQVTYFVWAATRYPGSALVADASAFVAAHPDARVEVAYPSHNESHSYVRPILVFHQRSHLFDAPAIQEYQLSGLDLPEGSVGTIQRCTIDAWLVARGGEPFTLRNRYPQTGHALLFPEAVRRAFLAAYTRSAATEYFDVWTCRQPGR